MGNGNWCRCPIQSLGLGDGNRTSAELKTNNLIRARLATIAPTKSIWAETVPVTYPRFLGHPTDPPATQRFTRVLRLFLRASEGRSCGRGLRVGAAASSAM